MSSHTWLPKKPTGYVWDMALKTHGRLAEIICKEFAIDLAALRGTVRTDAIVDARMAYAYIMRFTLRATYFRIGTDLGGRHHSTAINLIRRAENFIDTRQPAGLKILEIQKMLS